MKAVFLILSFVVVMILIRYIGVTLKEYLRGEAFKRRQKKIIEEREQNLINETSHNIKNNARVIISGSLNDANDIQNLAPKNSKVYRAKNGRFVSKNKLSNV
jgi:hypothetical protein